MANTLKSVQGRGTVSGADIYTVPVGAILTIVGMRAANNDNTQNHWFHIEINGFLVTGIETPLPVGSALEVTQANKIVAQEGDVITAYSDEDNVVDVTISYLLQD